MFHSPDDKTCLHPFIFEGQVLVSDGVSSTNVSFFYSPGKNITSEKDSKTRLVKVDGRNRGENETIHRK